MNFSVYWQHADAVSKTLYFILLAMSIATWTIFILRLLGTRQLKQQAYSQLVQALAQLKSKLQPLTFEQRKAVAEQALLRQISAEKSQAEKGVSVLGTIASLAPFVGLFGTVWGIFHALVAVGTSGQAGLAQVATPVGEALIMTGLGLSVAIPAVLAYNICVRFNRGLAHDLQDQAHSLLIDTTLQAQMRVGFDHHHAPKSIRDGGPGAHIGDNNGPTAANSAAAISQLNTRWRAGCASQGRNTRPKPAQVATDSQQITPDSAQNHISRSAWPSPTPTSTLTPDIATHQAFGFSPWHSAPRHRPDCASALSSSSARTGARAMRAARYSKYPAPAYGKAPPSHGQPRHSCCKPVPDSQTINT
jgi:biopolymer transport protein ExbB